MGNLSKAIKERIEANMYPRLFVMTQGFEIMPSKTDIIQKIYKFSNLDFRDKITGIPLQYDVYAQKIQVKTIKPKGFFWNTENDEDEVYHYIISDIEVNNILGNDPTKTGVTFYFKVNGTTQLINIKYSLFEDILADLGSYYSIFDLIAQILAKFYTDFFVQASLLNAVFTFNEYETKSKPSKKNKDLINYSNSQSNNEEPNDDNEPNRPNKQKQPDDETNIINIELKNVNHNDKSSDIKGLNNKSIKADFETMNRMTGVNAGT